MTQFRYLRKKDCEVFGIKPKASQYGGVTLAATFGVDECKVGFAVCSDKEKFCKQIGKRYAQDRLALLPITIKLSSIFEWLDANTKSIYTKRCNDRQRKTVTFSDINSEVVYSYFVSEILDEAIVKIMKH